jgi:hypothetical protein
MAKLKILLAGLDPEVGIPKVNVPALAIPVNGIVKVLPELVIVPTVRPVVPKLNV